MIVEDTPFDFRKGERVGEYIDFPHKQLKFGGGYDHNYVLKNYGLYEKVAALYSADTAIKMDVLTDNLTLIRICLFKFTGVDAVDLYFDDMEIIVNENE